MEIAIKPIAVPILQGRWIARRIEQESSPWASRVRIGLVNYCGMGFRIVASFHQKDSCPQNTLPIKRTVVSEVFKTLEDPCWYKFAEEVVKSVRRFYFRPS